MCFGEKITEIIDGGFGSGLLVRNVCVVKVVKFSILWVEKRILVDVITRVNLQIN